MSLHAIPGRSTRHRERRTAAEGTRAPNQRGRAADIAAATVAVIADEAQRPSPRLDLMVEAEAAGTPRGALAVGVDARAVAGMLPVRAGAEGSLG